MLNPEFPQLLLIRRAAQIVRDGVTECDQIAAEMKVQKYTVSRLGKRAMDAGLLQKRGRNYEVIQTGKDEK